MSLPPDLLAPGALGALGLGYLLGSIPFGLVLARALGLGDLRKIGSGNIGATNVLRTGNKAAAAATLILDALKGTLAVLAADALWGPTAAAVAGVAAMIGHCFPVWLGFKGGKGVATYLGALFALWPWGGLIACGVWLAVAFAARISSLAALVMLIATPLAAALMGQGALLWALVPMSAMAIFRHHANIARLMRGEEPRIGAKKP